MKIVAIIPARFASTRFPGKPLAMIHGKTMIERVYTQVLQSELFDGVYVATDDLRIHRHVLDFGGKSCMTDSELPNGTMRCWQAYNRLLESRQIDEADYIVNVQGDEPYISREALAPIVAELKKNSVSIVTLMKRIDCEEDLFSPNVVKVVFDSRNRALYFSRYAIPYCRGTEKDRYLEKTSFYKHIGVYAFAGKTLGELVNLPQGRLEECESLEQLKWLENAYEITMVSTTYENISVDVPEDIKRIEQRIYENH